ncbi:MAG: hypothetical protein HS116_01970 [Planctomycetes bacterium]|nr:hypothetical protein [Planctomycetota bacterium]
MSIESLHAWSRYGAYVCAAAVGIPGLLATGVIVWASAMGFVHSGVGVQLFSAYLFFCFASPACGLAVLIANGLMRRAARKADADADWTILKRTTWWAVAALLSGVVWLFLLPFVFFALGGSR